MSAKKSKTDRSMMGWLAAGMLLAVIHSPAWGLDLERGTAALESENAQIVSTLGHSRTFSQTTNQEARKTVQLRLVKRAKTKRSVYR